MFIPHRNQEVRVDVLCDSASRMYLIVSISASSSTFFLLSSGGHLSCTYPLWIHIIKIKVLKEIVTQRKIENIGFKAFIGFKAA